VSFGISTPVYIFLYHPQEHVHTRCFRVGFRVGFRVIWMLRIQITENPGASLPIWMLRIQITENPGASLPISWRSHDITEKPSAKRSRLEPSRGVNSTYGVRNYPMIEAVISSSVSEFWNLNTVYIFLYHPTRKHRVHTSSCE